MTEDIRLKTIFLGLPDEKAAFQFFLQKHGLGWEDDLTHAVALVDHDDEIVACGASNGRLLKCFAVDENLRGNNALGKLIQDLLIYCMENGCSNPMVVTKTHNIPLFESCGFSCVAKTDVVGLLERQPGGIRRFASSLQKAADKGQTAGAIVMNANPFTKGHRYLVETAASQCDVLYLFVVEEDRSVFPFQDRLRLVREGTEDIENVRVLAGGPYLISEATFPKYFLKENDDASAIQMTLDATVFAKGIAPVLGITTRFVGTEPNCGLTSEYNRVLQTVLSEYGIGLVEIPRIMSDGEAISASKVRSLLAKGAEAEELRKLLVECTCRYLESKEGGIVYGNQATHCCRNA